MTARNVRAYQTKGLIPPPTRSGRRSVYGAEHLQRLQAIERARSRGASLSLIAAHLAAGRPLEGDTLVDWNESDPGAAGAPDDRRRTLPATGPSGAATDIGPLLERLVIQRDATAQAQVEELVQAGIFRQDEGRVYTGRELAEALTDLQRQGLSLQVALGIAQRALRAAVPVAAALHDTVRSLNATGAAKSALGDVASSVMRYLISQPPPEPPA